MIYPTFFRGGGRRLPPCLLAAALVMLPLWGCDELLEVEDPDVVKPGQLQGTEAIPTLVNGATFDFASAFNGVFNTSLVPLQGLFTDEYLLAGTFGDRREVDQRNIERSDNTAVRQVYEALHLSRAAARRAADLIEENEPENANLSRVRTFEAYANLLLAESFCSGVPFSALVDNELTPGEPQATGQVLEEAVRVFDQALAADPDDNFAKVGKGRALLDLGLFQEAAAAVADVPTDFVELVRYSSTTPSQNNGLWGLSTNGRMSVWDNEGGEGLPFRSAMDPRVPWVDTGTLGFDEETPLFLQLIAPEIGSDLVVASGVEARLIEAEAALQAGERASFIALHNEARATGDGLDPFADTGQSFNELVDLHFRERAFWFYSTAHRLGDMRRLVGQYGRDAEDVFPTGDYIKGGSYGDDTSLPIPIEEDNNPNTAELLTGCLNEETWDVS